MTGQAEFNIGDRVWYEAHYDRTMRKRRAGVIGIDTRWGLMYEIRLDGATGSITCHAKSLTLMSALDRLVEEV